MIVKVGGCFGSELPGYHSAGFIVNDRLLLEGGTVTSTFSLREQAGITDICVSHIHLDHVKELAFFVDNISGRNSRPVVLAGVEDVIAGVRRQLFNDQLWPDFSRIPSPEHPLISYRVIPEGRFSRVAGLSVKPVRVNHPVPTTGYIIREPGVTIAYTGDTGPTGAIWRAARGLRDLKAVIVEASFPNAMEELAIASGHLTPALLERELAQLRRPEVPVYVVHMKPIYAEQIATELGYIRDRRIEMMHQGRSYTFRQ
jgi:cAMP phosphodiesterase